MPSDNNNNTKMTPEQLRQLRSKQSRDFKLLISHMRNQAWWEKGWSTQLLSRAIFTGAWATSSLGFYAGQHTTLPTVSQKLLGASYSPNTPLGIAMGSIGGASTGLFSGTKAHQWALELINHSNLLFKRGQDYCVQNKAKSSEAKTEPLLNEPHQIDDIENQSNFSEADVEKPLFKTQKSNQNWYSLDFALALGVAGPSTKASEAMQTQNQATQLQNIASIISSAGNNGFNMAQLRYILMRSWQGYQNDANSKFRTLSHQIQQARQLNTDDKQELLNKLKRYPIDKNRYNNDPLGTFTNLMMRIESVRQQVGEPSQEDKNKQYRGEMVKKTASYGVGAIFFINAIVGAIPYVFIFNYLQQQYKDAWAYLFSSTSFFNNAVINSITAYTMFMSFATFLDNLSNPFKPYNKKERFLLAGGMLLAGLFTLIPAVFTGSFYYQDTAENHGGIWAPFAGGANFLNIFYASLNKLGKPTYNKIHDYVDRHSQRCEDDKDLDKALDSLLNQASTIKDQYPQLFNAIIEHTHPQLFYTDSSSTMPSSEGSPQQAEEEKTDHTVGQQQQTDKQPSTYQRLRNNAETLFFTPEQLDQTKNNHQQNGDGRSGPEQDEQDTEHDNEGSINSSNNSPTN